MPLRRKHPRRGDVAAESSERSRTDPPGRIADTPARLARIPLGLAAAAAVETLWLLFLGWMAVFGG
jgi:hypothetical protein